MRPGLVLLGLLLGFLLIATGCASMSEDECLVADWQSIGFEDGAAGRPTSYVSQHRKACAKHGITLNKTAYDEGYQQGILGYCSFGRGRKAAVAGNIRADICPSESEYFAGYREGLQNFCTYDSGYDYGLSGNDYRRICPPETEPDFLDGFALGRHVSQLRKQWESLEQRLNGIIANREDNAELQRDLEQQLVMDETLTAEDRAQLLLEIDYQRDIDEELAEQERRAESDIADLQVQFQELGVSL